MPGLWPPPRQVVVVGDLAGERGGGPGQVRPLLLTTHCEGCGPGSTILSPRPLSLGKLRAREGVLTVTLQAFGRSGLVSRWLAARPPPACHTCPEGPRAACHLLWPFGLMRSEWGHRDSTLHTHPAMDPTTLLRRGQAVPSAPPSLPPPSPSKYHLPPFLPESPPSQSQLPRHVSYRCPGLPPQTLFSVEGLRSASICLPDKWGQFLPIVLS